jgi:hypothetical protein
MFIKTRIGLKRLWARYFAGIRRKDYRNPKYSQQTFRGLVQSLPELEPEELVYVILQSDN